MLLAHLYVVDFSGSGSLAFYLLLLVTRGAGHLYVSAADPITVRDLTR
jgi:hypothetical protein